MQGLELYEKVRAVPKEAQKTISGGRLNGKTDINPMWRIKTLTEQFGPCGIGWRYEIKDKRLERTESGETAAFVDIDLYIKADGEWSEAIPGTGGSMFIAKEKNGFYVSDECFKMALTDAISVACKALGVGADIYWEKDATKYDRPQNAAQGRKVPKYFCAVCGSEIPEKTHELSVKKYGKAYCSQACKDKDKAPQEPVKGA